MRHKFLLKRIAVLKTENAFFLHVSIAKLMGHLMR